MKDINAIEIRNITKAYRVKLPSEPNDKHSLMKRPKEKNENLIVLNGISLDVKKGEILGIIGRNGSGKSTLLKLISRIMEPDSGTIEVNGNVASILELGMGFHKDMSGRENIYIKGAMYGFNRIEIDKKIEEIIDYANLGDYIDNPIRMYSSGMVGRLAFSIMIHVNADIMLLDEILSTGDASFSIKAKEHFKQLVKSDKSVIIVSHSINTISDMCTRVIWINNGVIKENGKPKVVCGHYLNEMTESSEVLFDLANAGVTDAQYKLACIYRDGRSDIIANHIIAGEWMKKAAEQGHISAQADYADMLFNGIGMEENVSEAMYYYQSAADNNNEKARMKIAILNNKDADKDRTILIDLYRQIAENGDPIDQFRYADLILKTSTIADDRRKSFEMFMRSAENGYPDAQYQLGVMYRDGTGTVRDIKQSIEWLVRAGEAGHVKSQIMLADLYYEGIKVEKDDVEAFKWYLKAAQSGNSKSQYQIAIMYRDGIGTESSTNESTTWFKKFSYSGIVNYQNRMADILSRGFRTNKDLQMSCNLYEKSAECGNSNAMFQLGLYYEGNIDGIIDMNLTIKWLTLSANNGNVSAMNYLADLYYKGIRVPQDLEKAFYYYNNASNMGNEDATYRIAMMYKNGIGTVKDTNEYRTKIKLAVMRGSTSALSEIGFQFFQNQ